MIDPCDANCRDKYGDTPLIMASKRGCLSCVEALLAGKADAKVTAKHGDTALHWAAKKNYPDICKALMEAGARARVQDDAGTTPIHWAKGPELKVILGAACQFYSYFMPLLWVLHSDVPSPIITSFISISSVCTPMLNLQS